MHGERSDWEVARKLQSALDNSRTEQCEIALYRKNRKLLSHTHRETRHKFGSLINLLSTWQHSKAKTEIDHTFGC